MSVQVFYKNKAKSSGLGVIALFGNEKFQIQNLRSYFSKIEASYIEKISKKKKVFKVGIAHSCQKIKKVPTNQHDEKLDIIITEKYVLR